MASSHEHHVCINFGVKLGKTATETVVMLEQIFWNAAYSQGKVFEWHQWLREGQAIAEDDERSERP